MSTDKKTARDEIVAAYYEAIESFKRHKEQGAILVDSLIVQSMDDFGFVRNETWRLDNDYFRRIGDGVALTPSATMSADGVVHCRLIMIIRHDTKNFTEIPVVIRVVSLDGDAGVVVGDSTEPIRVNQSLPGYIEPFKERFLERLKAAVRGSVAPFL